MRLAECGCPWSRGPPDRTNGILNEGHDTAIQLARERSIAMAVDLLPPIHKDPFDRILVAQAQIEGLMLLTTDEIVARYPGSIRAL